MRPTRSARPGAGAPASAGPGAGPEYGRMIEALRLFLDRVAAARPDDDTTGRLAGDLTRWADALAPMAVGEREQVFARRLDLPGRGQTMSPALVVVDSDAHRIRGTVSYGRYFLGGGGAVHGGAVPLLFDEVMGRLANTAGRPPSRTAYLHVNFRAITPIDVPLEVSAWFAEEAGRKRIIRGELWHGGTLCADAEGLFVALRPGQP